MALINLKDSTMSGTIFLKNDVRLIVQVTADPRVKTHVHILSCRYLNYHPLKCRRIAPLL